MGLDDLPLASESDISIVSVVAQLSHLGLEEGAAKTHVVQISGPCNNMSMSRNLSSDICGLDFGWFKDTHKPLPVFSIVTSHSEL